MSEKINITNYEAFLLDYMEGNLSEEDISLLKDFVVSHPELNIDLNESELVELESEEITFSSKENLKKNPFDGSVANTISDELFVGYIEKTISKEEINKLEKACSEDKVLANELRLYKNTILSAETNIVFENKESLKKRNKIIWFNTRVYFRAAAAILLLFGLYFTFRFINTNGEKENKIANNNSAKKNNLSPNTVDVNHKTEKQNSVESFTVAKTNLANKKSVPHQTQDTINPIKNSLPLPQIVSNKVDTLAPNEKIKLAVITNDTLSAPIIIVKASDNNLKKKIITEISDDEIVSDSPIKEKSGFWAQARKALNNLNKLGIKQVDGKEQLVNDKEQTILSLGNFSIEKNNFNKE